MIAICARVALAVSLLLGGALRGIRSVGGRFLQRQDHPPPGRVRAGRRERRLGARDLAALRQSHSGQSDGGGAARAGLGRAARRQPALQHGAQGRHRDRHDQPRDPVRAAAGGQGHAVRRAEVHLYRQFRPRHHGLRCAQGLAGQDHAGPLYEGTLRRRHRLGRRHRGLSAVPLGVARNAVQAGAGLQGVGRDPARHGAQGGRGHLRGL